MSDGQTSAESSALAHKTIDAYLTTYQRRSRSRAGVAFGVAEADALVALTVVRTADARGSLDGAELPTLEKHTQAALEKGLTHAPSVDIAGLAWAEAYGVLPLDRPPLETLEWVLARGSIRGAIRGVGAAAWRALFLASAAPLLTYANRPSALRELDRWLAYLGRKVGAINVEGSLGQLRLAYPLAAAAGLTGDAGLLALANAYLAPVKASTASGSAVPDDLDTARILAYALALANLEETAVARALVGSVLENRLQFGTGLVMGAQDTDAKAELSPWTPLAIAETLPTSDSSNRRAATGKGKTRVLLRRLADRGSL